MLVKIGSFIFATLFFVSTSFASGFFGTVPGGGGGQITATYGTTALAAQFSVTSLGAYQTTSTSMTLPVAGTYLVWLTVEGTLNCTTAATSYVMAAELYNTTDAIDITASRATLLGRQLSGASYYFTGTSSTIVTTTASKVLTLYAYRDANSACTTWGTTTFNIAPLAGSTTSGTVIGYMRLN